MSREATARKAKIMKIHKPKNQSLETQEEFTEPLSEEGGAETCFCELGDLKQNADVKDVPNDCTNKTTLGGDAGDL